MKKNLAIIATSLALLSTAAAFAQTVHLRTTVPFNFSVGSKEFPAGRYEIQSDNTNPRVLYIRNLNSGEGTLAVLQSCEAAHVSSQTKLTFHRYGQQYFMAEVWVAGYAQGHQFKMDKREAEIARNFSKQEATLLASRK